MNSYFNCIVRDYFFMNVHNPPVPLYHSVKVRPTETFRNPEDLLRKPIAPIRIFVDVYSIFLFY